MDLGKVTNSLGFGFRALMINDAAFPDFFEIYNEEGLYKVNLILFSTKIRKAPSGFSIIIAALHLV